MARKTLTTSYLTRLTNANHDGVTRQISDCLQQARISHPMFTEAAQAVAKARQKEDEAYRRSSDKDFTSDDLKAADRLEDKYMSVIHGILRTLVYLPETEPLHRKAQLALQLFKDYHFATNNGFEAEASKTINMVQQWQSAKDYTLQELGIAEWVEKANAQAEKVLELVAQRVKNESMRVKGEMVAARAATDQAIRKAYELVAALNVFEPSAPLTKLISLLRAIEERARMYYLPVSKRGGDTAADGEAPAEEFPPLCDD